jgi:hypothetical protein
MKENRKDFTALKIIYFAFGKVWTIGSYHPNATEDLINNMAS